MVLSQRFASQGRIEETNAGFELVRKSEVQSFENRTKEKIHALTRKEMLPKIIIMSVIISIPVNSHLRSTWMPRVSVIPRLLRSERIWTGRRVDSLPSNAATQNRTSIVAGRFHACSPAPVPTDGLRDYRTLRAATVCCGNI